MPLDKKNAAISVALSVVEQAAGAGGWMCSGAMYVMNLGIDSLLHEGLSLYVSD